MPKLKVSQRQALPDTAFAYIDSRGQRRLPINDERHVRNALSRFNQVAFEDDHARERARKRLLTAAKRHGIMPIGFITAQIDAPREAAPRLPRGVVTFLLTDIESSTALVQVLGDAYALLLEEVRAVHRDAIRAAAGQEVDARGDEFFGAFESAPAAVEAAIAIQGGLRDRTWPEGLHVLVRIGIHTGRPTLTNVGYVGVDVHVAARVSAAGHGGQILLSSAARDAVQAAPPHASFRDLGSFRLRGLRHRQNLFQVDAADPRSDFPPPRASAAEP